MGTRRASGLRVLLAGIALAGAARATAAGPVTRPKLVQKRYVRITTGASVSATFKRAVVPGDLIVAWVVWDGGGAATLGDSGGDTWVTAVGPTSSASDANSAAVFYAANVTGGTTTVTATFANPVVARGALFIHEYAGLDRAAPLDGAVAATGSSAAMDSGLLTTHEPNALLFMGAESDIKVTRRSRGYRVRSHKYGTMTADQVVPAPGAYGATPAQAGGSWILQLVAFRPPGVTPPPSSAAYPLKVGPTGRYLVDQNGVPFLMTGDSPQALMVNLSESEADGFLADRAAAGFNTVWINLLCATYTGGRPDGSTYDGIVPFTTPDDLSTPNEQYFSRVDDMLRLAARYGLTVLLDPAETGSFLAVLSSNGVAKSRAYGRYLGSRYRSFDNIVWMSGNDFQTWPNPADDAVVQAVALGIRDTDTRHLHTVELDYQVSGSLDDPTWAPIIDLNASYTYFPTYAQVLADYDRPNARPTFLVEANYEFEHNAADEGTPQILRRQEYWSLLSGAAGQLYGNRYTWPFVAGWQDHLDTPGSVQVGYVKFLFASRRWYDLVPDQAHSVVTAGYGTFADSGALGDNDYVTAARTPDGALLMAYMPTRRTITVDMARLAGPAWASWYDPSNGTLTPIAGSPLPNGGARNLTPPGPNGDGDGDWVLLLEASAAPDGTPPSVPGGLSATAVSSSQLTIAWTASTDDVGVAGYRVYRDGVLVRTLPSTSFTDTGLSPVTSYSYRVGAYDWAGNASAQSDALPVTTAAPAPSFVQQASATPQTPQSVVMAAYTGAQTVGDTNIVAIGWNDTTSVISSVTDGSGNVYHPAVATFRGNGMSQAIYYAADIGAAAAGNQVTVAFDRPAVFVDLRVTEYSGLRPTSPFVSGVSATGIGSAASSGSLVTSAPSELLFAAGMTGASFTGAAPDYTTRVITAPDGDLIADAVAASPGTWGATASLSGGTWVLQLAAFAAAGS